MMPDYEFHCAHGNERITQHCRSFSQGLCPQCYPACLGGTAAALGVMAFALVDVPPVQATEGAEVDPELKLNLTHRACTGAGSQRRPGRLLPGHRSRGT
jgi:hypothetical protein